MNNNKFYGEYRSLVNSVGGKSVSSYKTSNLANVKNRFVERQKKAKLSDTDINKMGRVLNSIITALKNTDVDRIVYRAASEVAKNYKGGKGESLSKLQKDVDNLRGIITTLFSSLDIDMARVEKEVQDYYRRNGIKPGNLSSSSISDKQLADLNAIYSNHLENVPAARTALSNLFTILPGIRSGSTWKYETPQKLSRGLNGFISNIVGSMYEKKFHEMIKKMEKTGELLDLGSFKSQIVGGKNNKSDVNLWLVENASKLEKSKSKLYKLSLKSYKIHRGSGTALHGTSGDSISRDWKTKGKIASSPHTSRVIAQANARGLLKVSRKRILIDDEQFTKDFDSEKKIPNRTQVQSNLLRIMKNTLYYNADIFFGKDIVYLVGKNEYMTAKEFIDRLLVGSNGLSAYISGDEVNPNVEIVAHLAAEGRT